MQTIYSRHVSYGKYRVRTAWETDGEGYGFHNGRVLVEKDGQPLHVLPITEYRTAVDLATKLMLDDERANRPTVIDGCECFDSEGTLALTVDGYDILHLRVCEREPNDGAPRLTDEEHQKIIDVVAKALKVEFPS